MSKVYCGDCRWYSSGGDWTSSICRHPSNYIDTPTYRRLDLSGIFKKNLNNDCKDYELSLTFTEKLIEFINKWREIK